MSDDVIYIPLEKNWQEFLLGFIASAISKDEILEVIALKFDPGWAPYIVAETSTGETLSVTVIVKEIKEEEDPE